jgi:hypothetical protein
MPPAASASDLSAAAATVSELRGDQLGRAGGRSAADGNGFRLKAWGAVHYPPWTQRVLVGAGDGRA